MQILDCGCGPGSITLGLAPHVAPGQIRGLDINPQLVERAKAAAAEQGITNAQFEVGDAQAMTFADNTFDLVFSHALMEHLPKPHELLVEMKRVLKPGGMVAIRTPDWGGNQLYPDTNGLHRRLLKFHEHVFRYNQSDPYRGPDPYRGRHLGKMLVENGFEDLTITASYTCYGSNEKITYIAQLMSDHILGPNSEQLSVENGWGTAAEIEQVRSDLLAWAQMPGAFHLRAWIEAVARKP
jgi:SAM-dependent methyltransferase